MANAALDLIVMNHVAHIRQLTVAVQRETLDECSDDVMRELEDVSHAFAVAIVARRTFLQMRSVQQTAHPSET